jgi:hypothetical protein
MNKIFTLVAGCAFAMSANSQTYFSDDFEGASLSANEAWTIQTLSNPDGIDPWIQGSFSGKYAFCSNHVGGAGGTDHDLSTWLISPSINLSAATAVDFSFDNVTRYGSTDIIVKISTDYDGTSDPTVQGTWSDITSMFTLDTDDFNWDFASSGVADISAYISANTYIAYEFTATSADAPSWQIDNISIIENGTTPPTPTLTSIYDIQYTANADGISPEIDNIITTKGIVTGVYQIGSNADRFFIQDGDGAWNGIYVYENGTPVQLGDSVYVTGKVTEYFELTEIVSVTDVTVINSGNVQPTPVVVTGATYGNEEYEGVLVTLEGGINTVAPDQYGAWTANDGAGNAIIDDDLMASFVPVLGNGYDVTGVRHLSFGDNLILPRNAVSDIITVGFNSINPNNSELTIFPNPATDNVTVTGIENGNMTIYAISGEVVYNSKVNGITTINVADLKSGIYFVEVSKNNTKSTSKLIIK